MSVVQNNDFSERQYVIMLGTFDTKSEDFGYLYTCLAEKGLEVITLDVQQFLLKIYSRLSY